MALMGLHGSLSEYRNDIAVCEMYHAPRQLPTEPYQQDRHLKKVILNFGNCLSKYFVG